MGCCMEDHDTILRFVAPRYAWSSLKCSLIYISCIQLPDQFHNRGSLRCICTRPVETGLLDHGQ